jgi:GT2 family glycosyltransferase
VASIILICVNYYDDAQTTRFVRQILSAAGSAELRIIVANNNGPECEPVLTDEFASEAVVAVTNFGRNYGYYGAATLALQEYVRVHPWPDWIIVSNTDLLIDSATLFEQFDFYQGEQRVGVIAPAIISSSTGADQNPFFVRRPSAFRMHAIKWALKTRPTTLALTVAFRVKRWIKCHRWVLKPETVFASESGARRIYAPHGSFIAFSKEYFDRGGTLLHVPFLYGEEIMVAEAAQKLGLDVVFDPRFRIKHMEHSTTSKSSLVHHYQAESAEYCADTYFPLLKGRKEA